MFLIGGDFASLGAGLCPPATVACSVLAPSVGAWGWVLPGARLGVPHTSECHGARRGQDGCSAGGLSMSSPSSRGSGRGPCFAHRTPSLCCAGWAAPAPSPACVPEGCQGGTCCHPGWEGASARDRSSPRECFAAVSYGSGA